MKLLTMNEVDFSGYLCTDDPEMVALTREVKAQAAEVQRLERELLSTQRMIEQHVKETRRLHGMLELQETHGLSPAVMDKISDEFARWKADR